MLETGEIPTFTGNLGELEKDAAGLKSDASAIRTTGGDIHSKFQGLSAFYHAPEAEALFATTVPVRDKAKGFGDKLEKVSSALTEYAAEVRPLADKLDALKREAESFVSSVKGDKDWAYDKKKTDHQKRIRSDIDETVGAFYEAERRAANKITALVGGTTFVADDGSHKDNMYGFKADDLKHAKVPWGEPEEQRHHAYEIGYWVKSFVWDGLIVDGVWGTIKGLGTLVGFGGWDAFKNAWKGLGMLAVGVAVYSSPIGRAIPDSMLPKFVQDSKKVAREAGKAMLAWDEWKKNPARAAGAVTFNVLTSITGAGNVAKAGTVGKVVNVAGKVGKVIDPMTYVAKGLGKGLGALNISVPKVGDLMAGLKNGLGGNKVVPANFALPHDLSVAAPHTPNVTSVLPDKSVKLPDGTILHENGTMVSPKGAPHQNPIPVEASAADRAAHQQIPTPSRVEQPAFAHAGGGSADNAVHVGGSGGTADNAAAHTGGHAAESSLPSAGRGADSALPHSGAHTAEPAVHAGGGSADNAATHTGGARGADSAAHTGGHAAEPAAHGNGAHAGAADAGHGSTPHPGHDTPGSGAGGHGSEGHQGAGHETPASDHGHDGAGGNQHDAAHGGDSGGDHAAESPGAEHEPSGHHAAEDGVGAGSHHADDPQTMRDYTPPQDDPKSKIPVPPKEHGDIVLATGDHVYHEPHLTTIGYDSMTQLNRDLTARLEGYHDVVVHGNDKGFFMPGRKNAMGVDFPPGEVHATHIVEAIRNNPTYKGGPIRLISCHTGRVREGVSDIPAAQQVANDLGVPVMAPTDEVGIYPSRGKGQVPEVQNEGYWRTFLPMAQ
ncbi:hypothetical protein [Streptomyces sp. NPDC001678]|uniref:hypothetical protein n=1 Tax=Streptomyces sp. NPDC001678 TaxID=3364599 RepID=UPI00369F97AF